MYTVRCFKSWCEDPLYQVPMVETNTMTVCVSDFGLVANPEGAGENIMYAKVLRFYTRRHILYLRQHNTSIIKLHIRTSKYYICMNKCHVLSSQL